MKWYAKRMGSLLIIWSLPFAALAENHQPAVPESRTPGTAQAGSLASICDLTSKPKSVYIDENGRCWTQADEEATTEETASNDGVLRLRQYQLEQRSILSKASNMDEMQVLRAAMTRADMRESTAVRKGPYIFEGVFRYPVELEELRCKRTREVIQRIKPGIDEDPVYLEQLARQAASLEMVLPGGDLGESQDASRIPLHRILIGTVPAYKSKIETRRYGDYHLVILSDSFFSFIFQAAESVVLSWRVLGAKPGANYGFSPAQGDVEEVLKTDSGPQERLYTMLHRWLITTGLPHSQEFTTPPGPYRSAWDLIVDHAERFAIAHEYGHIVSDNLPVQDHEKELAADRFALKWETISAKKLDFLPPNIALQGGLFYLTALDIVRQALDMYECGYVTTDSGSKSHPPLQSRVEALKQAYRGQFGEGVKYTVPIEGAVGQGKTIDLDIKGALAPSETLKFLWSRIEKRFVKDPRSPANVHRIWDRNSCL